MNFDLFLPECSILVTGFLVLVFEGLLGKEKKEIIATISLGGLIISLFLVAFFFDRTAKIQGFSFNPFLRFFDLIYIGGAILILLFSPESIALRGEYTFFLFTSILGMMLLSKAENIFLIFLALEVLSFSLYALIAFLKESKLTAEASMKYFTLGAFSSAFMLFGFVILYMATGEVTVEGIMGKLVPLKELIQTRTDILSALILILIGFGFKLVFVPFQFWTPDVFEGTPSPVAGFLSSLPKAAAFAAFLKILNFSLGSLKFGWQPVIFYLSIFTMFWGNLSALREKNIKKILAYSTIAHAGYMLVGLLSNNAMGFSSLAFYLFIYAIMTLGAFGALNYFGFNPSIDDVRGFSKTNPLPAFLFTIALVSLAGIPPTAGFIAKFYIFMSAISTGNRTIALLGFLNSAISAYYYLRIALYMYAMEPNESSTRNLTLTDSGLVISAFLIILLGILPGSLLYLSSFKF